MRKNVSSQSIGVGMTSIVSGTDYTNSGAVVCYMVQDFSAIAPGTVNSGICIPRSYGAHLYIPAQSETNFNHILFTFVASGAITRHINVYTERVGVPAGADLATDISSIQVGVNSLYARVGAPVGASLAVDVSSIQVGVNSAAVQVNSNAVAISSAQIGVNSLYARVGAPIGANLATDIKSIQTQVDSIYGRIGENGINITSASVSVGGTTVTDISSAALARFFNRDSGLYYANATSGSVVKEIGYTAINSSVQVDSVQIGVNSLYARVGAPVGASLAVDVSSIAVQVSSVQVSVNSGATQVGSVFTATGSIQVGVNSLYARVGAPIGASLAVDVKSIQTQVDSIYARIGENGINITSASVSVGGATVTDIASSALARLFNRASGQFYTDAISGSLVREVAFTAINSSVQVNSVQVGVNSVIVNVASNATAINSVQIGVNSLYARVGAPVGVSLAVDVSSIQVGVNSLLSAPAGSTTVTDITSAALARFFNRDSGLYYASATSGSVVAEITKNAGGSGLTVTDIASGVWGSTSAAVLRSQIDSVQVGVNSLLTSTGSLHTRVSSIGTEAGSVQIGVNSLYARVGAPVGVSLAVDVSSIAVQVGSAVVAIGSLHTRVSSEATQVGSTYASTVVITTNLSSVQTGVDSIYARVGAPVGTSLAVDVASIAVQVGSNAIAISSLHTRVSSEAVNVASVQIGVNSLYARVGAPVGVSLAVDVASIQAGVNSLQPLSTNVSSVQIGVNSLYARVGAAIGASLAADVASVQTGVTSLAALIVGGRMLSDVTAINSDATAAANMAKTTRVIGRGTVTGGATVGNIPTASFTPAGVDAGQFNGRIITFDADTLTTALRGQATDILSCSADAAPTFGVSSLTTAPVSGNTFSVT